MNMPAAYSLSVSGKGKELERTFEEFLWAFLLSVIFMYLILAMNYESAPWMLREQRAELERVLEFKGGAKVLTELPPAEGRFP